MPRPYQERLLSERGVYEQCLHVHDLPPIFHYWSNRYVRPMFRKFGFDDLKDIFKDYLDGQCALRPDQPIRFISIGSGNCDFEIELVSHLRARGRSNFVLECLDVNSVMLERGRSASERDGFGAHMDFIEGDFNGWAPTRDYNAVIANQSLHHVLKLEDLFDQIRGSLTRDGVFIVSDMIGRNGHQRWPEALEIVHEFWKDLPPSYRFNQSLQRYQEMFENWDCSLEGFEGIRSQDILPLLIDHFHFKLFLPFGNVIDPFTDRPFGFNFDAGAAWDQAFIDRVQLRDQGEMIAGRIKPTHLLAVLGVSPCASPIMVEPLTPIFCVRTPGELSPTYNGSHSYNWGAWPHSDRSELQSACRHLKEGDDKIVTLEREVQERTAWARQLEEQLDDRTAWALRVEKDQQERTDWALRLEKEADDLKTRVLDLQRELQDRTDWTHQLEDQISERIAWAQERNRTVQNLEASLQERTDWARGLEVAVTERTEWAHRLQAELDQVTSRLAELESDVPGRIRTPLRAFVRAFREVRRRIRGLDHRESPRM